MKILLNFLPVLSSKPVVCRCASSFLRLGRGTLVLLALALAATSALAASGDHGIIAGRLDVGQVSTNDDNVANLSLDFGIGTFAVLSGNRADYSVRIGPGVEGCYDEARGVLLASVTQNGRDNFGTNGYPAAGIERNNSGTYRIVTFLSPGNEYNVNVAGAWFPYDLYLGGLARNATAINGAVNDTLTGSPGLRIGTHFSPTAAGQFVVDLRSFGIDSRTDGVLLVNHAKDEDNFALSQVNTTNGTWNVFVRDIGASSYSSYEQDPVAFVFIPKTNNAVVSGRFNGDGSIGLFSGSSPQFTVTNIGVGSWDLRIPGHSANNGVLIISPEGGGSLNGDNIVSYQAYTDGSGWELQSRDTPANGLQTPVGPGGAPEAVASFVYIPDIPAGVGVATTNSLVTTGAGEAASFTVVLKTKPTSLATINLGSTDPSRGVPSPSSLIFGPGDWYTPQTVTVTGEPGAAYGPYHIVTGLASSSDRRYQGLNPADVPVLSLPNRALLVAPADQGSNINNAPLLQALITNNTTSGLTVKFFGRPAPTLLPGPDFTLVVLPDTQMYTGLRSGGLPEMFVEQTEWTIANRLGRNIPYLTQLGDISNNGDTPAYVFQWYNATNAMYRLENPVQTQLPQGIPYGVAVGNHEFTPIGNAASGTTSNYNRYFGVSHFLGRDYYAGHYGTNNNNHYDFFSASGLDFIVVYFEYDVNPSAQLLAWADGLLRANPRRRAIIVTHNMGNTQTPLVWSDQARAIYETLKGNTNLFMMLGGHITGQGRREDVYQGRVVHTFVQDYQGWEKGGNGFMRLFEFSPTNNMIVAQTYSPVKDEFLTDENSEFFFPYDMRLAGPGAPQPFTALATNQNVTPGTLSSLPWPGREKNQSYEWYIAVTDSTGYTVTSPVWRFTTTAINTPPTVTNMLRVIVGDTPATLQVFGSDANGDALTFTNRTLPSRGLLPSFNPDTGTFIYWPARGFRGSDRFTFSASDGQAESGAATMNFDVVAPPDTNTNNLPDGWEAAYGVSASDDDDDQDGMSNVSEYYANTDPTNAASVFRLGGAVREPGGSVVLRWSSVGGTRYRVRFADADGFTGVFTDWIRDLALEMDPGPYGSPSLQSFTDTSAATNSGGRFYQIKVVP